ncbi:hypothetical protein OEA41_004072 [Lepraria neglecta]|uniref:Uncharacterized protein n=1 Tax=Lepraria neglecta TaxID=209136 RepID=A0AAE0DM21_9LECA|nr:hypothetical protein OEA41_004072 [Lepraria neglecta]
MAKNEKSRVGSERLTSKIKKKESVSKAPDIVVPRYRFNALTRPILLEALSGQAKLPYSLECVILDRVMNQSFVERRGVQIDDISRNSPAKQSVRLSINKGSAASTQLTFTYAVSIYLLSSLLPAVNKCISAWDDSLNAEDTLVEAADSPYDADSPSALLESHLEPVIYIKYHFEGLKFGLLQYTKGYD